MRYYSGNDFDNYAKASQTRFESSSIYYWEPWQMIGNGGNDTLLGGEVNDTIYGDATLYSATRSDSLSRLGGCYTVYGGNGNDTVLPSFLTSPLSKRGLERSKCYFRRVAYPLYANLIFAF